MLAVLIFHALVTYRASDFEDGFMGLLADYVGCVDTLSNGYLIYPSLCNEDFESDNQTFSFKAVKKIKNWYTRKSGTVHQFSRHISGKHSLLSQEDIEFLESTEFKTHELLFIYHLSRLNIVCTRKNEPMHSRHESI